MKMLSLLIVSSILCLAPCLSWTADAPAPKQSSNKPKLEVLLKPKSIKRMNEDHDIVVNAEWASEKEFKFVAAMKVNATAAFARDVVRDYSVYPKMSSTIKKFEYDSKKSEISLIAEAGGFVMHSLIKVTEKFWDEIEYEIIGGSLVGFKLKTSIYSDGQKSALVLSGSHPDIKSMIPAALSLIVIPLSETVLGVAAGNFRSYIESEYTKKKDGRSG